MTTKLWETDEIISTVLTQLNNHGCSLTLVEDEAQRDNVLDSIRMECKRKDHGVVARVISSKRPEVHEYPAVVMALSSDGEISLEEEPISLCIVRVFPLSYSNMFFDRLIEVGVLTCFSGSNE